MKKAVHILATIIVCILIVGCDQSIKTDSVPPYGGLVGDKHFNNISGIVGFSELKGIGVGITKNTNSSARALEDDPLQYTQTKLVGLDESGVYKAIVFYDEYGNEISQEDYLLINYLTYSRYTFFQFAPPQFAEWIGKENVGTTCGTFDSSATANGPINDYFSMAYHWSAVNNFIGRNPQMQSEFAVYVLDNETGKIYCLLDENGEIIYPGFSAHPSIYTGGNTISFISIQNSYSNYQYVSGHEGNLEYASYWDINQERNNMFMSIEDGLLKLFETNTPSKLNDWDNNTYIDRYGNIFSGNFKYMVDTNGTLKAMNGNCYIGMNNIVYCGADWYNEKGELEKAQFIPASTYFCDDYNAKLVKQNGLSSFFLEGDKVVNVTFSNEEMIEYAIEEIKLQNFDSASNTICEISNGRIILLTGSKIVYYNPEDGVQNVLSDQYFYNSMKCYPDGTIRFAGLDSNMADIMGIIYPDGTVDVSTTSKLNYTIIYLNPIN